MSETDQFNKESLDEALMECVELAGEKGADDHWQQHLFERHPELFQDRNKSMRETAMCWGCQCQSGWATILDKLCCELTLIRNVSGIKMVFSTVKEKYGSLRVYLTGESHTPQTKLGRIWDNLKWRFNIERYELMKALFPNYTARREHRNQVWNNIIDACVSSAERSSCHTCEICGEYGKGNQPGYGGWYYTRCSKHWEGPGTYEKPIEVDEEEAPKTEAPAAVTAEEAAVAKPDASVGTGEI